MKEENDKKEMIKNIIEGDSILNKSVNVNVKKVKENKRKKKKNVPKSAFLILKKNQKKQVVKSRVQQYLNELFKKGYKNEDQIKGWFSQNEGNISSKQLGLYKVILESKVDNGRLRVSDNLANRPLIGYSFAGGAELATFSNDRLYLNYLYYNILDQLNYKFAIKISEVYSVAFCSPPFSENVRIERGYYQDFSSNFAAIGLELLSEDDVKKFLGFEVGASFKFEYCGVQYTSHTYKGATLIFTEEDKESIVDLVKKMKYIKSGSVIELDPKFVRVGQDKIRFIDTEVKPEDFCPAFLSIKTDDLPEKRYAVNMLFKIKFYYNEFFNNVCSNIKKAKKGDKWFYDDFFFWDNMPQCFEFCGILGYASMPKIDGEDAKILTKIYTKYIDYKPLLDAWKSNQLKFQKLCIDFYSSFHSRISYDKMVKLKKNVEEYISIRNELFKDETYDQVAELFNIDIAEICNNNMVTNQLSKKGVELGNTLLKVLSNIVSFEYNALIEDIRFVCSVIYYSSYHQDNDKRKDLLFPVLLSPGAFLGNLFEDKLLGEVVSFDPIKEMIDKLEKKKDKMDVEEENENDLVNELVNSLPKFRNEVVRNTVVDYVEAKKYNLSKAEIDNLALNIAVDIERDNLDILNKSVVDNYSKNKSMKNAIIDSKYVSNKIDNYILKKQNKSLQNQEEKLRLKKIKNEINNKINEIDDKESDEEKESALADEETNDTYVGQFNYEDYGFYLDDPLEEQIKKDNNYVKVVTGPENYKYHIIEVRDLKNAGLLRDAITDSFTKASAAAKKSPRDRKLRLYKTILGEKKNFYEKRYKELLKENKK